MKRILPVVAWLVYGIGLGIIYSPRGIVWWALGLLLAGGLIVADRLLYIWWFKPFEQLSIQFHYWWHQRAYLSAFRLLYERRDEQTKLVLKSLGFAGIWPLITVYVLTSTGSITAAGMVMALGFRLVMALVSDWKKPDGLSKWFCWQIKREIAVREVRIMAGGFIGVWLVVVGLMLLR